jgi:hypothetical protein
MTPHPMDTMPADIAEEDDPRELHRLVRRQERQGIALDGIAHEWRLLEDRARNAAWMPLSGRVQHVQHAEMPLIFGIKGREVFRRAQSDLLDVEALGAGSRQRHRGRNQHLEPKEAACNDERRSEHEWLFRHGFVSEVAEAPWGSSDRAAACTETLS